MFLVFQDLLMVRFVCQTPWLREPMSSLLVTQHKLEWPWGHAAVVVGNSDVMLWGLDSFQCH